MKKRVLASVLSLVMGAALLAGCGGSSASSAASQAAPSEAASAEESKEEAAAPEIAADAITIKLATTKASNSYAYEGLVRMRDRVAERSNGTINIEIYADSQLGGQVEAIEGMEMGTIEMAYLAAGAAEGFYPQIGLMGVLFSAKNEDHALKIWKSDKASEIVESMASEIGFRNIDYSIEGARNIWSKKEVQKLDDLAGLKMRVPEVPMFIDSFSALGVNPTPMAISEVYTGLQTGIIDGLEYDMSGVQDFNFYDHCKYCYQTNHGTSILAFMVSESFWQGLTDEQRQIISDAMTEVSDELNKEYYEAKESAIKFLEEQGVTFVEPSAEDRAKIEEIVTPILSQYTSAYATEEDLAYMKNLA